MLFTIGLHAQELLPFVENFTKTEYHGDNQNWNVTQGKDNAIYFANNHYFLRYNGVKWEKYTLPNKTIIRAVYAIGDKIYCGSYKEFGYWQRIDGKMKYFSLSEGKNLFSGRSANEEIWKIFTQGGRIYFQSFNELFVYDAHGVEKIRFPFQISYCYLVDNQIYIASVRNGVYVMQGKRFVKKENWSEIEHDVIHHIEKNQGKTYIFTKANGIFIEEGNQLTAWNNLLNNDLKTEVILTAKFVSDSILTIGTVQQGLYIFNLKDNSFKSINRQNAIKNNAVLSILLDNENDLWLGLDNGIAHVEINSSVNVFTDNSGVLGSVYAMSMIDDDYLFVTNHGAFIYKDKRLRPIPNSQGQVWDIYKLDGNYIMGHNDGTFVYDGKQLRKVNNVSGGWKFVKSDYDKAYFQAHYSGIVYYTNEDLASYRTLEGLTKPIRNIVQNKPNELWAADNYRSLYRITYDSNFKTQKVENISQRNGISNDFGVKIFGYKNEILFLINKIWYRYNSISAKLERDKVFNAAFPNISDIIPVDDEHFLILNSGLLYVISQVNNEFIWELIPEKYYEGKLIIEDSRIFKKDNKIFLNLDDGFMSYELNRNRVNAGKVVVEGFYEGNLIKPNTEIKYNHPVEINVVTGRYGYNQQDIFYRLNDGKEYLRVRNGNILLNNLHSGNQRVAFYYFNGKNYVELAEYQFDVNNPWYFSVWMVLVYVLAISGSFYLYYKWNKLRYTQKLQLKEEELNHQQKILELELKAQNELNIQEYEKHILELEIQSKSSEVAGKSLSIAKQSEMIDNIRQILQQEEDIDKLKSGILKAIKINAVNKHEWEVFESNISQIHHEFISGISSKFPQLTSKDIKLCVYLKMNLSSKEIAPLMNISFRGVELHRYRLRKKLGLSPDENLYKFMLTI
ncbi:histidine kinase [Flavobacterium sp.]|uniref:helix-turn-helix and ligand-binding sensor domain-containing protein n=1 Tax=Flavobacterium sp. TaxID=239 RepID=UPI0039E2EB1F